MTQATENQKLEGKTTQGHGMTPEQRSNAIALYDRFHTLSRDGAVSCEESPVEIISNGPALYLKGASRQFSGLEIQFSYSATTKVAELRFQRHSETGIGNETVGVRSDFNIKHTRPWSPSEDVSGNYRGKDADFDEFVELALGEVKNVYCIREIDVNNYW